MERQWEKIYRQKLRTPEEAAQLVKSGDWFFCGCREGVSTLAAIWDREDLHDLHYYCGQLEKIETVLKSKAGESADLYTGFLSKITQPYYLSNRLNFTPGHFSGAGKRLEEFYHSRVAIACVSAPDKDGYVSFGNSADYVAGLVRKIPVVIAEINPHLPFVCGDNLMHISEFDAIVEGAGYKLNSTHIDVDETNEDYKRIGGYLSELLDDGATIEIGIGRLNSAAMLHLEGVKDLGIHTEVFGDAMMDLIERGIVTNERKTIYKGISVCCQLVGTQEMYDYCSHNQSINMMAAQTCVNPAVIAQNYRMTAINNAINVDLFGEVNAESLKSRQYTGMGGIGDFSRGACMCPGGKSIIVVESTTKDGKHSKIVPFFAPGTPVSVPRTDIDYVVTENGVAKLAGASVQQKCHELIKVAHPNFREDLIAQAKALEIY